MRRKPVVCVGTMIVIAAITFCAVALSIMTREPRKITFSQDLANQISMGMTRDEVQAILGRPPGDYTTGPCDEPPLGSRAFIRDKWFSDTGVIIVLFNDRERVVAVEFWPMRRESFFDRWHRWLPW
jgi:hypothetical protein